MIDFWKLFTRDVTRRNPPSPSLPDPGNAPTLPCGEGLEVEYRSLIVHELRRAGISPQCASIEVRRLGHGPQGFDVLAGMIRLQQWERTSALRLMLGLPLLEARVRRSVRATWLADYSHFEGLWLHASEQIVQPGNLGELKDLFRALTAATSTAQGSDHTD